MCRCGSQEQVPEEGSGRFRRVPEFAGVGSGGGFRKMERPCGPILGNDAMLGFPVAPLPMMKNKHGTVTMVSMALWLWPSWHCGYGLHGTVVMAFMALWL